MQKPTLGVMTFYLNANQRLDDKKFMIQLQRAAKNMNLDLFVFTPEDVDNEKRRIYAHLYDFSQKKWKRQWRRFPDMVFDRCRYQPNKRFQLLRKFRADYPHLIYLNRPLRNKWETHQLLYKHDSLKNNLPETRLFTKIEDVTQMLKHTGTVYIKPVNGTGGRGILKVKKKGSHVYTIQGRHMNRSIIGPVSCTLEQLTSKLNAWKKSKRLLVQQGLDLTLPNGRVHDYRMLIQKNKQGKWAVTGIAGRVGARNSVTSNLHGGGKAADAEKLLRHWVGKSMSPGRIIREMERVAFKTIKVIEKQYGKLCELALDLAVDRKGRVWLLEINPKPAREVFNQIGNKKIYYTAIRRPLEYSLWLWKASKKSSVTS